MQNWLFSLNSFEATRYLTVRPENLPDPIPQIEFTYHFKSTVEGQQFIVSLEVLVMFEGADQVLHELSTRTSFNIENGEADWRKGSELPAPLMTSMVGIAYASTRGLLIEKSGGTVLMPMQDIARMVVPDLKEEVHIFY